MEERHWWFANKLQETFKFGGFDSPTLLEDFLADTDVCELLNKFLGPGEPRKLFFYCDKVTHGSSAPRKLHLTPRLSHDVAKYYGLCFYVLRKEPNWEIDVNDMEKELICGEVRFSGLSTFTLLLSEAFLPLLEANKEWGQCSEEEVTQFLSTLDKFLGILSDMSTVQEAKRPVLEKAKVPSIRLGPLSSSTTSSVVPEIVNDLEGLVAEWINTIDRFLADAVEDRQIDPYSVPLNEVKKWKHRLLLLTSIVEQIKSKDCSGIITILVAAKSKLLKKWKSVDSNLTKAYNDARSKTRFLEYLQPFFEELSSSSNPSHVAKVTLPHLCSTLSQPAAIPYAKSGYLGVLMSKVTNSLVQVCLRAVTLATVRKKGNVARVEEDRFWDEVEDATSAEASNSISKVSGSQPTSSSLMALLSTFQQLKGTYRQLLLKLKEDLQGSISLPGVVSALGSSRGLGASSSTTHLSPLIGRHTKEKKGKSLDVSFDLGAPSLSPLSAGISLTNVDIIMQNLVDFCTRAGQLHSVIQSMGQFKAFSTCSVGLPHAPHAFWDLSPPVLSEIKSQQSAVQIEVKKKTVSKDSLLHRVLKTGEVEDGDPITEDEGIDTDTLSRTSTPEDHKQSNVIQIASEVFVMDEGVLEEDGGQGQIAVSSSQQVGNESLFSEQKNDVSMRSEVDQVPVDDEVLHQVEEGSPRALVNHRLSEIMFSLRRCNPAQFSSANHLTTAFLIFSTHGEHEEIFKTTFGDFLSHVDRLEKDITTYIHHLFQQKMPSVVALGYVDKFGPLHSRAASLRPALYEATVGILRLYVNELEELQNHYEQHKASPQGLRGAPKVVKAVSWSRELYDRISKPMKIFSRNKSIAHTNEHSYSIKLYNKFSLALVRFEDQWVDQWRTGVAAKAKAVNNTLLERVVPPGTQGSGIVQVNPSVECLLEVLEEAKGLAKLNVAIPESTRSLINQESRIKGYKHHLDEIVKMFYSTCKSVDSSLMLLLQPHAAQVLKALQPGWSTLTWNSLNIDAFLHQAYSTLEHLREVAACVGDISRDKVKPKLKELSQLSILEYDKLEGVAWLPKDFLQSVCKQAASASRLVSEVVSQAESGVIEILEETQKMEALVLPSFSPSKPSSRQPKTATKHTITGKKGKLTSTKASTTKDKVLKKEITKVEDAVQQSSQAVVGTPHSQYQSRDQSSKTNSNARTPQSQPPTGKSLSILLCTQFAHSTAVHEVVADFNRQMMNSLKAAVVSCLDLLHHSLATSHSSNKCAQKGNDEEDVTTSGILFTLGIQFFIPQVAMQPSLAELCATVDKATNAIIDSCARVGAWTPPPTERRPVSVVTAIRGDPDVAALQRKVVLAIRNLEKPILEHLDSLSPFDPLWQRDLHTTYRAFLEENPTVDQCTREVDLHHAVEKKVSLIPEKFVVCCVHLTMEPMKHTLLSLARAWKIKFSSYLHQLAKGLLDDILLQHKDFTVKLGKEVETLENLRDSINLLHDIMDLENVIDNKFLEVEKLYSLLKEHEIRLPRQECQQVSTLRVDWKEIMELAERVQHSLLAKRRIHFEHLVDSEVQSFNVDSNQFHNSFDSEGPLVPGLSSTEAVRRLGIFLGRYREFQEKADLLNVVQRQLDMQVTPFSELVRTGEDLAYLNTLYDTYQKFIEFNERFQEQLWAQVDLKKAISRVEGFWQKCQSLPPEQQHWEASKKLTQKISHCRDLLPLLLRLHGKEICTRHWLQVMTVTGCTLQLEANVFRLKHLVASKLLDHQTDIEAIIESAQHEQNLENQLNDIKEEWTEQLLQFETYKSHGKVLLSQSFTRGLLEQLEHAHTSLSIMLKSTYIRPHRDEAAQWSLKLTSISDVLLKWLSVQELWQSLEAVFSNEKAMKEFADEVVKFSTLNTSWLKLMGSASETRNAINCCLSDDITKNKLLDQLQQEMEECKKSLSSYLSAKKKSFPRFNFISDSVLLGILSATNAVESIRPYLPSLFGSISEVGITHLYDIDHGSWPVVSSVSSFEGETLELAETVVLGGDLESWLSAVIGEVKTTLQGKMSTAIAEIYEALSEKENKFEGFVRKHHCQVACVAAHYYWTQETSKALEVCRYDRRAVPSTKSRFNMMVVNKLTAILGRGKWKNPECVLSHLDRTKLEVLAVFSIALRDMSEDLVHRKLRDVSDFEWQRFPRVNSLSELTITEQLFTAEQENTEELVEGHSNPGPLSLVVDCLDTSFLYAYEYLGCKLYPVFTPRTLNCIVAFTQSLMKYSGCELAGPVGSGKKGFVDGLGMLYGRHVFFVHCNQLTSPSIIRSIMEGSSQCGSWSCFVGVTELRSEVLSLLAHLLQVITTALKAKERTFTLPTGQQVPVLEGFGTFVTRTDVAKAVSLPSYIREHFRSFTLSFPPTGILFRVNAAILGYKQPRLLADRLVMMHTLIHEQIPDSTLSLQSLVTVLRVMARRQQQLAKRCYQPQQQQQQQQQEEEREHQPDLLLQHSPQRSLEEPPGTISSHSVASPLHPSEGAPVEVTTTQVVPFRLEHVLVVRGIVEIIMPQFPESDLPVFTAVLRDTFSGVVDASELDSIIKDGNHLSVVSSQPPKIASNPLKPHESKPRASLGAVSILKKNITEEDGGIFPILMEQLRSSQFALHPPWLAKVSQVVQALSSMHAVVLCGGAGTGKSTCIDAIISAENTLRSSEASNDEGALPVKLHKIFPRVFPSPPELYGMVNDKGEWSDGVFSALLRKTLLAQQSVSWYSFDGPLDTSWVDYLSSLLDSSRVFEHPNGDHLSIRKKDVKFIFETGDIKDTSPVVLTHCGLVHFDPSTLDWRVLVNAWLDTRKPHEVQCLRKYIDTIIDPVCQFVLKKLGRGYCMAGIINTTLSYLTSLLNMYAETAEAFSESHVERLFLFAVIWGCGGPLDEELQVEFSNILKKLTNGLPDDDSVESVFEYYVDESGEWDVWQTCVPRVDYSTQLDPINGLFIETDKTICIKVLLDLALRAKQHVMLVGASGSGKSTVTNNFLSQRGASHSKTESLRKIAMNEDTRTQFLHTFMKLNFHRRQGQTYGPYQGRVMDLFIDDLHLPSASTEGSVIEFIRQLVDVHGLYNLSRQHEWSHVEDFVIFATAGSENKQNKEMNRTINDPRAKRHFAVMRFPTLQGSDVRFLVEKLAEGYLLFKGEGTVLTKEIVFTIASVTLELYSEVSSTFSESSLPGRQHYMFSLHHVALLYQGLHQCLQSVPHAAVLLPSLWIHEGVRVFCDSVSRERDYMWFHTKVNHLSQDIESEDIDVEIDMDFIAVTSLPLVHKSMSVHDSDLNAVKKVNLSPISHWDDLRSSLTQYLTRYQEEHGPLDLTLSDINIQYLVRLHRSFTSSNSSGHVVIGALGTPRDELIKLALYIAGCTTVKVTRSTRNPLEHAKQGLFQQAGLEKKKVSVIINERNMRDPGFLQVLASFLSCGEFPVSFTSEEEDGLRQAVGPSIKRDFPGRKVEPLQYFNRFVQNNLCVVISIPSDHELVNGRAKAYSSFLHCCNILDLCEWRPDGLFCTAKTIVNRHVLEDSIEPDLIDSLVKCVAALHTTLLQETSHLLRAGFYPQVENLDSSSAVPQLNGTDSSQDCNGVEQSISTLRSTLNRPEIIIEEEEEPSTDNSDILSHSSTMDLFSAIDWEPKVSYVYGHIPCIRGPETALTASSSLTEKVYLLHKEQTSSLHSSLDEIFLPFVGHHLLEQFLECLCSLFIVKNKEARDRKEQLTQSLDTLEKICSEVESLKKSLQELNKQYKEAENTSSSLMEGLSAKTCQKEVLMAKLGHESSVRKAMNVVADQDQTLDYRDDESLLDITFVGAEKRSSRLCTLIEHCEKQLEEALQEEETLGESVQLLHQEAKDILSKIDRNTVDQVKSLNNPPSLVGSAMELIIRILQPTHPEAHELLTSSEGSVSTLTRGNIVDSALVTAPSRSTPRSKRMSAGSIPLQSSKGVHKGMKKEDWMKVQLAIGDSQKFLDLLHGLSWEGGLNTDVAQLIDSRLANSHNFDTLEDLPQSKLKLPPKHPVSGQDLITVELAKHASEAVGLFCSFLVSTVEHHFLLDPYRRAKEKVKRLERELKDLKDTEMPSLSEIMAAGQPSNIMEESQPSEDDVEKLSREIDELHEQFDKAVLDKHRLHNQCTSYGEKLKTANQLLSCLKDKQERWTEELENFPEQAQILGGSILTAAFMVYAAALRPAHRSKVLGWFRTVLQQYNMEVPSKFSISKFLIGAPQIYKYILDDIPSDPSTVDSASVVLSIHTHCTSWPLICDTYKFSLQLLRKRFVGRLAVVPARSPQVQKKLVDCLSEGTPLVITDVEPGDIVRNEDIVFLLNLKKQIGKPGLTDPPGKKCVKIKIGEREVECSPKFCVFLITHSPFEAIPVADAAKVILVNFVPERKGLEDHLFGQFLSVQNMKTYNDWRDLHERIYKDALKEEKLELKMLEVLSTAEHADNPETAKNLMQLDSSHHEASEDLLRCQRTLKELDTYKLSVTRTLAHRASVILQVVFCMSNLKPIYRASYEQVKSPILNFISHIGRINNEKEAVAKLTTDSHALFVQSYREADQLIFGFALAVEIEASEGRVGNKEREFFIRPHVGSAFKVREITPITSDSGDWNHEWLNFGKKPFDWMKDSQWKRLLMLATEFAWSHPLLRNLNREGKEYVWRQLGEERCSEISEGIKRHNLPGKDLTWMQRFLMSRCFRPDRLPYLLNVFTKTAYTTPAQSGNLKRGYLDLNIDLTAIIKTVSPKQAILLMFQDEPHIIVPKLSQLADRLRVVFDVVHTFGNNINVAQLRRTLMDAIDQGHWLLLHCVHTSKPLLKELPHLLHEVRQQASVENGFRLWLSADSSADLPSNLIFSVTKISMDSPVSVPYSVPHSLACTAGKLVQGSMRQDWLPLLHNLSLLHAVLRGRAMIYPHAWTAKYNWGYQQLMDIMNFALGDFVATECAVQMGNTVRLVSWAGIRHMITEVLYGSHVTNMADQSTLNVLTEYWVHPIGSKRDIMDMPRGIYHMPGIFYQPGTRLPALIQAVESASLAFSAELCGLHHTSKAQLWMDSEILERFNYFFGQISQTERDPNFAPLIFDSKPPHTAVAMAMQNVMSLGVFSVTYASSRHTSHTPESSFITPRSRPSNSDVSSEGLLSLDRRRRTAVSDISDHHLMALHSSSSMSISSTPGKRRVTFTGHRVSSSTHNAETMFSSGDHLNFSFYLRKIVEKTFCKWKEEPKTGSGMPYLAETIYDKLQKFSHDPSFYHFLLREVTHVMKNMRAIRAEVQELSQVMKEPKVGDQCPDHLAKSALSLIKGRTPKSWADRLGPASPPLSMDGLNWVQDLQQRYSFLDKLLKETTPVVNLGSFLYPQAYCSIFKQEALRKHVSKTGSTDHMIFRVKVEPTNREKENIRDPPAEGIFAHGLHMWGVEWEKSASLEIMDIEPKQSPPSPLPVLHLTAVPHSDGPPKENTKGPFLYNSPCFMSTTNPGPHLLDVCFTSTDTPPARWQVRGVACYLRNF